MKWLHKVDLHALLGDAIVIFVTILFAATVIVIERHYHQYPLN